MITLWLTMCLALGSDVLLAPRIEDLDRSMTRVAEILVEAQVQVSRLAEAQNAWVEDGCVSRRCGLDRGVALVVESRDAGHRARDLIQSARAELARAQRAAAFEAVQPLLDKERRRRLAELATRIDEDVRAWSARSAWQAHYVEPWARTYRDRVRAACIPKAAP